MQGIEFQSAALKIQIIWKIIFAEDAKLAWMLVWTDANEKSAPLSSAMYSFRKEI